MVNVRYAPIKELLIYDAEKVSVKDLIISRVSPNSPPRLFWCDGILFFFYNLADPKDLDEKMEKGVMVWTRVFYAELPEYKAILEADTEQFGGIKANVDNVSSYKLYKSFTTWAKSQKGE